jgi:hypothetical protein
MNKEKRRWSTPQVRSFGTFETATQGCGDKDHGAGDGLLFKAPEVCEAS